MQIDNSTAKFDAFRFTAVWNRRSWCFLHGKLYVVMDVQPLPILNWVVGEREEGGGTQPGGETQGGEQCDRRQDYCVVGDLERIGVW
jgi:hypothetical protein